MGPWIRCSSTSGIRGAGASREYEEAFELRSGPRTARRARCSARLQQLAQGRPAHGIPRDPPDGQSVLARGLVDERGPARARALRAADAARALAHAGRQGARALDAIWCQRAGAGASLLAELLQRARDRAARAARNGLAPPSARGGLRLLRGAGRGSAQRRLARSCRCGRIRASPTASEEPLPSWARPLLPRRGRADRRRALPADVPVRSRELPPPVQRAYLDGALHLLPFPGSLVFWGVPQYRKLAGRAALRHADSAAPSVERHEGPSGIRVPQSGWLHEAQAGQAGPATPARSAAQRLQAHAPLGARPASPGRARADGPRRQARARALQHARRTTCASTASRWPATRRSGRRTSERVLDGPDGDARGPEGGRRRREPGRPSSATASSIRRCASAATRSTGSGRSPRSSTRRRDRQRCCAMGRSATSRPTTPRSWTSRDRSSCGRACSSGPRTSRPSSSPGRRTRPSRTRRAATRASCSMRQTSSAQRRCRAPSPARC